jgi:hypothetical protein
MKKILEYVEFITACANAITKGFKTVSENWPTTNPFSGGGSNASTNGQA